MEEQPVNLIHGLGLNPCRRLNDHGPFRVVSSAFFLDKGFLAGTRLPLGSFPSDFKIRRICQQENDVKPDSHDHNRLERRKR